jgi:hypothetical protein
MTLTMALVILLVAIPPATLQAQTLLECRGSRPFQDGQPASFACDRPNGLALQIQLAPSSYTYVDNPPCEQGDTDRLVRNLLSAALAERERATSSGLSTFWGRLRARAGQLGGASNLMNGVSRSQGSAVCQAFILPVRVAWERIGQIDYRAVQASSRQTACSTQRFLFDLPGERPLELRPPSRTCAVGWAAWQSAAVVRDGETGVIVGAVFKNWSANVRRTGQLWVWY